MEEAYSGDINENIENDIYSLWLNAYSKDDYDEFKISDLAKRFNVPIRKIIEVVKDDLKTDYLKILSTDELRKLYATLKLHEESAGNKLQMEVIRSIINDR